jgi:predicted MPP superfamily phosphohydrolase
MARLIGFFIFLLFYLGFEAISYNGLRVIFDNTVLFNVIFSISSGIGALGFYKAITQFSGIERNSTVNFIIGFALTLFVSKMFFSAGLLFQDFVRLFIGAVNYVVSIFNGHVGSLISDRSPIINYFILGLSSIPFLSMLYGITKGKYKFTVNKIKLKIDNLPEAFEGFRIGQISDIHSGTFDSKKQVEKGIAMLNGETPDMVVFTGDLINFHKDEIDPYIESFQKIEAPFGKYSILGNHDYYGMANVPKNEQANYFTEFGKKHEQIAFNLLRNEHVKVHKDGQSINLIGVENWGIGGFPKTGDLNKALFGADNNKVNILLSHDPSHWDHVVLPHKQKIDLTLSGHTHGMQFGINLPKFKWSPVQYRYKRWMGLYKEADQYLYINRGFGFLGFPGRVFMWPEITIIELEGIR